MSPEEAHRSANEEALGLVDQRREELFGPRDAFSIEPPADSLRQRIQRGEWGADEAPLDLPALLEIAAENSREVARRKEDLYLTALDVTLERFRFSWIPAAGGDVTASGSGGEGESVSGSGGASLSKLLGSGARVLLDVGASFLRLVGNGDGFDVFSDFGMSISQPLLRGSGRRIVREPLTQAERNLVYEARSFERFRRTFAVDVVNRMFRVLQQRDIVRNQTQNAESLKVLRERNQALAEAGRLSDIQSDQARQDELRSESRLLDVEQTLTDRLDDLKFFLGLPIDAPVEITFAELEELRARRGELFDAYEDDMEEEQVVGLALERRLDLMTAQDAVTDAERKLYIAKDALRAGMSVFADARASSPANKPLSPRMNDVDWNVGVDLELPFGRLPQRNAMRAAEIVLVRAERTATELSDGIRADLRALLREARTRRRTWELQQSAVEVAQRRVDSARLYLDAGRADTRDLLEAQEALLSAQNAATAALIDYALAKLSLLRDMELLEITPEGIRIAPDWNVQASAPMGGTAPTAVDASDLRTETRT